MAIITLGISFFDSFKVKENFESSEIPIQLLVLKEEKEPEEFAATGALIRTNYKP